MHRGFRYPCKIIRQMVWLYFRFSLSFRDIEELMASRGIIVTYETIRQWTLKLGQRYANKRRRRQLRSGDKWQFCYDNTMKPSAWRNGAAIRTPASRSGLLQTRLDL